MWNNLSEYCNQFYLHQATNAVSNDWPESTRLFLEKLQLPRIHPYCIQQNLYPDAEWMDMLGVWRGQPVSFSESLITVIYLYVPSLVATIGLLIRLAAGYVAPIGTAILVMQFYTGAPSSCKTRLDDFKESKKSSAAQFVTAWTGLSSLILMTDSMYLMEYHGSGVYGMNFLLASLVLSCWNPRRSLQTQQFFQGFMTKHPVVFLIILVSMVHAAHILWVCWINWWDEDILIDGIPKGLYASKHNPLIQKIVQQWSVPDYTRATPWILTGDARTGLPFLWNRVPSPKWTRVFLPVPDSHDEGQILALDFCFPPGGYNPEQPLYLIFHGANGGSTEEYVKDFASRQFSSFNGSTVAVLIARGLMDLPLKPFAFFHAGRTSDAHQAAVALRQAMSPDQVLAGVGYSMGAIVLNNYAIRLDCALDIAFSISGSLDCRFQQNFTRSQKLWQPMISYHVRQDQHLAKWGKLLERHWTRDRMTQFLRATNMVELDHFSHNASDLTKFYADMSVLGDVSKEDSFSDSARTNNSTASSSQIPLHARIHQLSIPLCILHTLDDPISTWRNVVGRPGSIMVPASLVESGNGNLMVLLTEKGGHVGWPEGWLPWRTNWAFMSNAASSFVEAFVRAKTEQKVHELSS